MSFRIYRFISFDKAKSSSFGTITAFILLETGESNNYKINNPITIDHISIYYYFFKSPLDIFNYIFIREIYIHICIYIN